MYEVELIREAGLTPGEAKVYLALLELGTSTAGPIIEKSKVSPSFVYNILNSLIGKGLASFVLKEETRHYQAAEPSRILDYLRVRRETLEKNEKRIEDLLPKLLLMQSMAAQNSVALFQGFKGVQTCFERYQLKQKKGDEWLCFGILANQDEKYHSYWKRQHQKRIKEGIAARMLFNTDTPAAVLANRNSYKGCDSRYMPTDVRTPAWFFVYADVTVIFLQSGEFAIEITSAEVAQTFRQYFDDYWKASKKLA